jgi:hypothetical protein
MQNEIINPKIETMIPYRQIRCILSLGINIKVINESKSIIRLTGEPIRITIPKNIPNIIPPTIPPEGAHAIDKKPINREKYIKVMINNHEKYRSLISRRGWCCSRRESLLCFFPAGSSDASRTSRILGRFSSVGDFFIFIFILSNNPNTAKSLHLIYNRFNAIE